MPLNQAELEKRFTYHAPLKDSKLDGLDQLERYEAIREGAKFFAEDIVRMTPESREQSLAITHLEDAVMWANAAIARNEPVEVVALAEEVTNTNHA